MSVQKSQFDFEGAHQAPPVVDYERVVKYDEKSGEVITYREVDYPEITASLGVADDWSLDSLMKAGIPVQSAIHTGLNSRIEGASVVEAAASEVEKLFSEPNKDSE